MIHVAQGCRAGRVGPPEGAAGWTACCSRPGRPRAQLWTACIRPAPAPPSQPQARTHSERTSERAAMGWHSRPVWSGPALQSGPGRGAGCGGVSGLRPNAGQQPATGRAAVACNSARGDGNDCACVDMISDGLEGRDNSESLLGADSAPRTAGCCSQRAQGSSQRAVRLPTGSDQARPMPPATRSTQPCVWPLSAPAYILAIRVGPGQCLLHHALSELIPLTRPSPAGGMHGGNH